MQTAQRALANTQKRDEGKAPSRDAPVALTSPLPWRAIGKNAKNASRSDDGTLIRTYGGLCLYALAHDLSNEFALYILLADWRANEGRGDQYLSRDAVYQIAESAGFEERTIARILQSGEQQGLWEWHTNGKLWLRGYESLCKLWGVLPRRAVYVRRERIEGRRLSDAEYWRIAGEMALSGSPNWYRYGLEIGPNLMRKAELYAAFLAGQGDAEYVRETLQTLTDKSKSTLRRYEIVAGIEVIETNVESHIPEDQEDAWQTAQVIPSSEQIGPGYWYECGVCGKRFPARDEDGLDMRGAVRTHIRIEHPEYNVDRWALMCAQGPNVYHSPVMIAPGGRLRKVTRRLKKRRRKVCPGGNTPLPLEAGDSPTSRGGHNTHCDPPADDSRQRRYLRRFTDYKRAHRAADRTGEPVLEFGGERNGALRWQIVLPEGCQP